MDVPSGVLLSLIHSEMRRFLNPSFDKYTDEDISQLELLTRICLIYSLADMNEDAIMLGNELMQKFTDWHLKTTWDDGSGLRYRIKAFLQSQFLPVTHQDTDPLDLPVSIQEDEETDSQENSSPCNKTVDGCENNVDENCAGSTELPESPPLRQYTLGPIEPVIGETFFGENEAISQSDGSKWHRTLRCEAVTDKNTGGQNKCLCCGIGEYCENVHCHPHNRKDGKDVLFIQVLKAGDRVSTAFGLRRFESCRSQFGTGCKLCRTKDIGQIR